MDTQANQTEQQAVTIVRGNPYMRAITAEDFENRATNPWIYNKLDALLKSWQPTSTQLTTLIKEYSAWQKDAQLREKQARLAEIKKQMALLKISVEDLK